MRPFGVRSDIDFGRVDRELISPVLDDLAIEGRTTEELVHAGNIRTDMFERLLLADIVIADISIHNANVYYELGVRHALRPRTTILIRARRDEVPFDLKTDRYLEYDALDPATARAKLTDAVKQSLIAENADSPVFLLLPALRASDPETFRPVPPAFAEDVRAAQRREDLPRLAVLGEEAEDFDWGLAGTRLVGRAQFNLGAWGDARATWEAIRSRRPDDAEANLTLGTVFQRLGDPVASTAAIERALQSELDANQRAEARALLTRNAKDRWVADWRDEPDRAAAALRSPFLEDARVGYNDAFSADLNHWYSGINALALVVVTIELARQVPEVWAEGFEDDGAAELAAKRLEQARVELATVVRRSLEAQAFRDQGHSYDVWAELSRADLRLLTTEKPGYIADAYARARARFAETGTGRFPAESAARQLRLYLDLGVITEKATAALTALGAAEHPPAPPPRPRILVFSGHRLDAPGRSEPRFPPASEGTAAAMIRDAIRAEQQLAAGQPMEGIAGGASGGDILFHEICAELGIPTQLLLALPKDDYAAQSVLDAGPDWTERFRTLCERLNTSILSTSSELPSWLASRKDYGLWERNNRWTLHTALSRADADVTLLVLWDGKSGDGPGGTKDMVHLAKTRGVRVIELDARELAPHA